MAVAADIGARLVEPTSDSERGCPHPEWARLWQTAPVEHPYHASPEIHSYVRNSLRHRYP